MDGLSEYASPTFCPALFAGPPALETVLEVMSAFGSVTKDRGGGENCTYVVTVTVIGVWLDTVVFTVVVATVDDTVETDTTTTVVTAVTVPVDVTVESPTTLAVPCETVLVVVTEAVEKTSVVVVVDLIAVRGGGRFRILVQILLPGAGDALSTLMMVGISPLSQPDCARASSGCATAAEAVRDWRSNKSTALTRENHILGQQ